MKLRNKAARCIALAIVLYASLPTYAQWEGALERGIFERKEQLSERNNQSDSKTKASNCNSLPGTPTTSRVTSAVTETRWGGQYESDNFQGGLSHLPFAQKTARTVTDDTNCAPRAQDLSAPEPRKNTPAKARSETFFDRELDTAK
jgi:hypothetical protein